MLKAFANHEFLVHFFKLKISQLLVIVNLMELIDTNNGFLALTTEFALKHNCLAPGSQLFHCINLY